MTEEDPVQQDVIAALRQHWRFDPTDIREIFDGRNSRVWRVSDGVATHAAKLVRPHDSNPDHFDAGLRVAAALDSPTMPTGSPVTTVSREYTVPVAGGRLALMRWVFGTPLDGNRAADVRLLGASLARLHAHGMRIEPPDIPRWPWTWVSLDRLPALDPSDTDLVDRAVALAQKGSYSHGILHGDPAPDAFIAVADDDVGIGVGIIDWASVLYGPVLYDLATLALVIRRRGASPDQADALVAAYARHSGMSSAELSRLDAMRALRLATEVMYHTTRIDVLDDRHMIANHQAHLARSRRQLAGVLG